MLLLTLLKVSVIRPKPARSSLSNLALGKLRAGLIWAGLLGVVVSRSPGSLTVVTLGHGSLPFLGRRCIVNFVVRFVRYDCDLTVTRIRVREVSVPARR